MRNGTLPNGYWINEVSDDLFAKLAQIAHTYNRNNALLRIDSRPQDNHEVWKVCANCGAWFDARWGWYCPDCNYDNTP